MHKHRTELLSLSSLIGAPVEVSYWRPPATGWVKAIRNALNMTLAQLGKRLGISKQGVSQLEVREADGSVTLNSLREVARVLDMQFVYAILPREGTLEAYVERQAERYARRIIAGSNQQMVLEEQGVEYGPLKQMLREMITELTMNVDRQIWD